MKKTMMKRWVPHGWVDGVLTDDGNLSSIPLSMNEDPCLINIVHKS